MATAVGGPCVRTPPGPGPGPGTVLESMTLLLPVSACGNLGEPVGDVPLAGGTVVLVVGGVADLLEAEDRLAQVLLGAAEGVDVSFGGTVLENSY